MPEKRDVETYISMLIYSVTMFAVCYALAVMLSGIHIIDGYLDVRYEFDLLRFILTIIVLGLAGIILRIDRIGDPSFSHSLGSPRVLHVLSALTFVISVVASLFSSRLQPVIEGWAYRAVDYSGNTDDLLVSPVSPYIILTAFIFTILVFFLAHGKHAHKINRAIDERNQKQSKDLREAIRVAPPPYFIKMLADMTDKSEDFLSIMKLEFARIEGVIANEHASEDGRHIGIEELLDKQRVSIRAVLMAFGRLAKTYDNVDPSNKENEIEYRANLMLTLSPESDVFAKIFPEGLPEVRFEIPTGGSPAYYLVVDKRLSVNVGKQIKELFVIEKFEGVESDQITPNNFTPDRLVKNALLPVYWKKDNGNLVNYNMIGAPQAIYHGENVFIGDTIEATKQSTQFTKDIQTAALTYFENDKKGRSIVSLPVATRHYKNHPKEETSPDNYLGTINLYRNTPNIFSGNKANFTFFSDFTRPLSIILARKVEIHMATLLQYCELSNDK